MKASGSFFVTEATSSGGALVAVEGILEKWLITKVARENGIAPEIIEAYAFFSVIRY